MTREEALITVNSIDRNILTDKECYVVDNIFELVEPSLPSNLDEAAKEFANKEFPNEPAVGQWGTGDYEPPIDMEYPREIAKDAFIIGAEWMAKHGWEEVNEADYPKPDKHKIYCVYTKGHYLLATVILHPNDDALCQWRSTEFPHHRYDMCEGDSYIEIRKKQ